MTSPAEAEREHNLTGEQRRFLWLGGSVLLIGLLIVAAEYMRRQGADPRAWLGEVWGTMMAAPPRFLLIAMALKLTCVALDSFAWMVTLRAAFPDRQIMFRQVFGIVQGGVGILTIIPPKFGGIPVLGLYRAVLPDLPLTTMVASRGVQGAASWITGTVIVLAFGATSVEAGGDEGWTARALRFAQEQPLLALLAAVGVAGLAVLLARQGRSWVRAIGQQLLYAGAIVRQPGRYVLLVALPTVLAFALRWAMTATLLMAFAIPVSLETLVRVNVAHGLARSVQVTPGGFGTTQVFDLVALRGFATPEVITAYSLAQSALLLFFNVLCGLLAVLWVLGWDRTAGLFKRTRDRDAMPVMPTKANAST
ncbi:MAG: lysylphosphatidylglycerol synthase domain-containing protein [Thermomicrobiales bacterium]